MMQDRQTQRKEAEAAENVTAEGSFYNDAIFQQQRLRLHYRHVTSQAEASTWRAPLPGTASGQPEPGTAASESDSST